MSNKVPLARTHDPAGLERFREIPRLRHRCSDEAVASPEPGVTEREARRRLRRRPFDRGVDARPHIPFAWFGDRGDFRGFRPPGPAGPGTRRRRACGRWNRTSASAVSA